LTMRATPQRLRVCYGILGFNVPLDTV